MNELVRAAILGTGQSGPLADETGTAVDALVGKLGTLERERALLLRAGGAFVMSRAGARAKRFAESIDAAPAETLRRASPRLSAMITELLNGQYALVVPEALEAMARAGLRLPEELLPLALGMRDADARKHLPKVLGERGRWLARHRPAWKWASADTEAPELPPDADERWAEGTAAERRPLIALARRVSPERGRAWIESSFKSDKPELRVEWLEALAVGLSAADVPFAESALHDRSRPVRIAAARLLWRISESGVARQVRERIGALFQAPAAPSGVLGKLKELAGQSARRAATANETGANTALHVELPPEPFDKALERLGIEEAPRSDVGKRQFWLAQLVSAVPPDWFVERCAAPAEKLLTIAANHDLSMTLLNGWTSGALRFESSAWYAPLWDAWLEHAPESAWFESHPLVRLTERLPPVDRDPRVLKALREKKNIGPLSNVPSPWSEGLSRAFLERMRARDPEVMPLVPSAAACIPLHLIIGQFQVPAVDAAMDPLEHMLFETFSSVVDFRRRLFEEMKE